MRKRETFREEERDRDWKRDGRTEIWRQKGDREEEERETETDIERNRYRDIERERERGGERKK